MARSVPPPALVVTTHDPDGRYRAALRARRDDLGGFPGMYAAVTPATGAETTELLRAAGAVVVPVPAGRAGTARRAALGAAHAAGHGAFLACDLDRLLHWAGCYPAELFGLPARLARRRPAPWFACLGRTARAYATHPPVQRLTEAATNRALAAALGRRVDATAGACWLSPDGAERVLAGSTEESAATDLEWPALVHRAAPGRLAALFLEGLEFETAAFHAAEIAAAGSEAAWVRARYDRPDEWLRRTRLAADSIAAACRVLGPAAGEDTAR